jgi:NAD+ kinase
MSNQPVVLFRKLSKLEWDARRYNEPPEAMPALYASQGIDVRAILDSHARQQETFDRIVMLLQKHYGLTPPVVDSWSFIKGDHVAFSLLRNADLVIASVGDELATSVARVLGTNRLLPINADPLTSEGALLWPSVELFEKYIGSILDGLPYCFWPRIRAVLDGQHIGDAIGDVYVGAKERLHISCYSIRTPAGTIENQKSSGVIITTGAGSTGWYRSCYWDEYNSDFVPADKGATFVVTEPYRGKLTSSYNLTRGFIRPGEELRIRSLMPDGLIVIDNKVSIRFDRDNEVILRADDNTVNINAGSVQGTASQEIFIGNRYRQLISRFLITTHTGYSEQVKSSGLLVATSSGAPRWLSPASATLPNGKNCDSLFDRESNLLKYLVTEPTLPEFKEVRGEVLPNSTLRVTSRMPEGGIVSLDSYSNHLFPAGATVELSISPVPFKVIPPPE